MSKDKNAIEEYMARTDLPESLKAANREFVGVPDEWASSIEEGAHKAALLAADLEKWQTFAKSTWVAPAGLLKAVATLEGDHPLILSLAQAVDLMAFGGEPVPDLMLDSGKLETGARRRQAFEALRNAAHQGRFPLEHGADAEPIRPGQFQSIQGMGGEIDSLEFNDSKEGEPDKHLETVQIVNAAKFYAWLRQIPGSSSSARGAKRGPKFTYDWDEGAAYFDRLLTDRGDLDDRPEWSAKADIEREIMAHMRKYGGGEPSASQVQAYVKKWLEQFRAGMPASN